MDSRCKNIDINMDHQSILVVDRISEVLHNIDLGSSSSSQRSLQSTIPPQHSLTADSDGGIMESEDGWDTYGGSELST